MSKHNKRAATSYLCKQCINSCISQKQKLTLNVSSDVDITQKNKNSENSGCLRINKYINLQRFKPIGRRSQTGHSQKRTNKRRNLITNELKPKTRGEEICFTQNINYIQTESQEKQEQRSKNQKNFTPSRERQFSQEKMGLKEQQFDQACEIGAVIQQPQIVDSDVFEELIQQSAFGQ